MSKQINYVNNEKLLVQDLAKIDLYVDDIIAYDKKENKVIKIKGTEVIFPSIYATDSYQSTWKDLKRVVTNYEEDAKKIGLDRSLLFTKYETYGIPGAITFYIFNEFMEKDITGTIFETDIEFFLTSSVDWISGLSGDTFDRGVELYNKFYSITKEDGPLIKLFETLDYTDPNTLTKLNDINQFEILKKVFEDDSEMVVIDVIAEKMIEFGYIHKSIYLTKDILQINPEFKKSDELFLSSEYQNKLFEVGKFALENKIKLNIPEGTKFKDINKLRELDLLSEF